MTQMKSRFPIWQWNHTGSHAMWVVPMAGGNTQLQYGRFKDLDMQSLRPARDQLGPITASTTDGRLRAQVRIRDAWRHIDVLSKLKSGDEVACQMPKSWQHVLEELGSAKPALPGVYYVNGVRATRLRAIYLDDPGAPWMLPGAAMDRIVGAELADHIWDQMINLLGKPRPLRAEAHNNPWVWIYRLKARDTCG